ncbi:MAG: sugar transferase [Bacteroidetes bacterium]|nr:sugar transferase [Bacteroidota bacterium]
MKRIFDIVASGLGIILLSPFFLILFICIKLDSKGSVLYKQIRVGRFNKDFELYKFRSMAIGSDKKSLITIGGHDSRITRSGYYIRKFKLDELPQLINVLKGDMSIVGPRPEVRKYVDLYSKEQLHVLDVRPGITDMASICYRNENELLEKSNDPETFYREVVMQDKLAINKEYIEKSSFCFDLKLIFKTLKVIIKN